MHSVHGQANSKNMPNMQIKAFIIYTGIDCTGMHTVQVQAAPLNLS
jgi:hypothetical protein